MTHVCILIPQGVAVLNSIVRLFKIFDWINCYLNEKGGEFLFDVHLVGITTRADLSGGRFSVRPDLILADVSTTDLILIQALAGDIAGGIKRNTAFFPWLKEQYGAGAQIAGLCTGAFLLAETGFTDDQKRGTHWFVAAEFRKEFSNINEVTEKIILEARAIYPGEGAYSFIDLLLRILAGRAATLRHLKKYLEDSAGYSARVAFAI